MRAITGSTLALTTRDFATHAYLAVDGVPVQDVLGYNPFMRGSWDHDLDAPVASGQFGIDLGNPRVGLTSPLHSGGVQLEGRPLFDAGRYLDLYTATVARGSVPAGAGDYRRVFQGRIDDYDPAASGQQDELTINARDICCDLLDTWIETVGSDSAVRFDENLIIARLQAMLDYVMVPYTVNITDAYFAGHEVPFVLGNTPGPSFVVADKPPQNPGPLLLAMRELALLTGWDLRGMFGRGGIGTDNYGLVFYDVNRGNLVPYYTFPAWRYDRPTRMAVSRNTVRNRVRVVPNTSDRAPINVRDNISQGNYGPRFMELAEGWTSHIDTVDEGTDLANFALSDLKDPKADWVVPMPYWWPAEINDRYEFEPESDGIHFDQTTALVVSGFKHTLENGEGRTELRMRTTAAAANLEWRRRRPIDRLIYDVAPPDGIHAKEGTLVLQVESLEYL